MDKKSLAMLERAFVAKCRRCRSFYFPGHASPGYWSDVCEKLDLYETVVDRVEDLITENAALRQTCADAYVMFGPMAKDGDEIAMLDRLAKVANGGK